MNRQVLPPNAPVSEQAAAWFFELADGPIDRAARREFVGWLKRSPQHIDAFLAIAVLDQELSDLPGDLETALATLDRSAPLVALVGSGNDSANDTTTPRTARRSVPVPRILGWIAAAGLAAAALVSGLTFVSREAQPPAVVHKTDFGEQRSIALSDGSIVTLNTRSEVSVGFDDSERKIELVAGEALFDVARDSRRPFMVDTGSVALRVLGTKFSVYRTEKSIRLAVVEGVVRATPNQMPDENVLVSAGEGAVALDGVIRHRDDIDVGKAIAWTERRLIFDDVPLEEVVLEFNRYNRTPLVVQDPQLAQRRITSVFFANDVSALIAFLELEPDVEVDYGVDAVRIRSEH
jgi:transmembrane sensor